MFSRSSGISQQREAAARGKVKALLDLARWGWEGDSVLSSSVEIKVKERGVGCSLRTRYFG